MENTKNMNYFQVMKTVDVSEHVENKKDLSYLSWAYAFAYVTDIDPAWIYEVREYGENQTPYLYDPNLGYMVATKVTIQGVTKCMYLPVMDGNNRAMLDHAYEVTTKSGKSVVKPATMFDINKTIMRCLVKNIAVFGLGLTLYAGDDLPDVEADLKAMKEAEVESKKILELQNELKELKVKGKDLEGYSAFVKEAIKASGKTFAEMNSTDLTKLVNSIKKKFFSDTLGDD